MHSRKVYTGHRGCEGILCLLEGKTLAAKMVLKFRACVFARAVYLIFPIPIEGSIHMMPRGRDAGQYQ